MRPSVKYPTVLMPRPTKASLARQLKIRNSISISSIINTEQIKSENDLRTIGLTKRTGIIIKNPYLFKRRQSLNKLSVITSNVRPRTRSALSRRNGVFELSANFLFI